MADLDQIPLMASPAMPFGLSWWAVSSGRPLRGHLASRSVQMALKPFGPHAPCSWRTDCGAEELKKPKGRRPPWYWVFRRVTLDMNTYEVIDVWTLGDDEVYDQGRSRGHVPGGPRNICTYFWVEPGKEDLGYTCPGCNQWVQPSDRILRQTLERRDLVKCDITHSQRFLRNYWKQLSEPRLRISRQDMDDAEAKATVLVCMALLRGEANPLRCQYIGKRCWPRNASSAPVHFSMAPDRGSSSTTGYVRASQVDELPQLFELHKATDRFALDLAPEGVPDFDLEERIRWVGWSCFDCDEGVGWEWLS